MPKTATPPHLWTYREVAILLGLDETNGYRLVSELVDAWEITPKTMAFPRRKCLTWAEVQVIARAMNRTLIQPPRRSSA